MSVFGYSSRRLRVFLILLAIFFFPPSLYFLGTAVQPMIAMVGFLPALIWINIPAIIFSTLGALLGISVYEFREFGAMPEGIIGWGLIIFFWATAAFLLSLLADRIRSR